PWVSRDRWEALTDEQRRGFAPLCPDAAFEIRSENRLTELQAKVAAYLTNGVRLALIIDPQAHTVEVHRAAGETQILRDARTISLDPQLPGFVLDLRPFFG